MDESVESLVTKLSHPPGFHHAVAVQVVAPVTVGPTCCPRNRWYMFWP